VKNGSCDNQHDQAPEPQPRSRRDLLARVVVPFILLAGAIALVAIFFVNWDKWVGDRIAQETDDAYLQANVTPISARVNGYVRRVAVQDYAHVIAGQPLYEIVDDDYRAQLSQAEFNLAASKAAIESTRAQHDLQLSVVKQAQAQTDRDHLQLGNDQTDLRRYNDLSSSGAVTRQVADTQRAKTNQDQALIREDEARVVAQQKQLTVYDAQVVQGQADVGARQAAADLARITLGYTLISAPASGVVGQRQVQVGQYVNVGSQLITLVPLPDVWVVANYKETQLTRVRVGQAASVRVDAFPDQALRGRVDTISPASGAQFSLLPPDNATGNFTKVVQRVAVKIIIDRPNPLQDLLRPGMSVEATIYTDKPSPNTRP
jgi:membrane fusion protein (multidrug efflux system)